MEISYTYEPSRAYAAAIAGATTPAELESALTTYSLLASDALDAFNSHDFRFSEWRDGLLQERRGEFAGKAWIIKYGAIVMPSLMMRVELFAYQYQVPFGLAYIKLRESGQIVERAGRASWRS